MRTIILLFFISINLSVFSQDDIKINHYQRKANFSKMITINSSFNANDYFIYIPDSIYNSGDIFIKKGLINEMKFKSMNLFFTNKIYTQITFTIKGKKSIEKLQEQFEFNKNNQNISNDCMMIKGVKSSIILNYTKNSATITIALPNC